MPLNRNCTRTDWSIKDQSSTDANSSFPDAKERPECRTFHALPGIQALARLSSLSLHVKPAASWALIHLELLQQLPLSILDGSVYHIIQASALVILRRHVKDAIISYKILDSL
jgi:hypothetical protein